MVSVTLVSTLVGIELILAPPACSASPVCSLSSNNYPVVTRIIVTLCDYDPINTLSARSVVDQLRTIIEIITC